MTLSHATKNIKQEKNTRGDQLPLCSFPYVYLPLVGQYRIRK